MNHYETTVTLKSGKTVAYTVSAAAARDAVKAAHLNFPGAEIKINGIAYAKESETARSEIWAAIDGSHELWIKKAVKQ